MQLTSDGQCIESAKLVDLGCSLKHKGTVCLTLVSVSHLPVQAYLRNFMKLYLMAYLDECTNAPELVRHTQLHRSQEVSLGHYPRSVNLQVFWCRLCCALQDHLMNTLKAILLWCTCCDCMCLAWASCGILHDPWDLLYSSTPLTSAM